MAIFATVGSLTAAHLTGLTLFGISFASNDLVTINPTTGAGTVVGPLGDTIFATGLGTTNGKLYAFDQVNDRLREISKVSGEIVRSIDIGVGNLTGEGALAFRPGNDGVGFLFSPLNAKNEPVNDFYMFTIAPSGTAGSSSRIGTTGVAIDAMAFNSQGTLYALGQDDATLYVINTTSGAATAVGQVKVGADLVIKNSPIAGMTIAPVNPQGLEEIYASINDRLYIINPTSGAARVASADVINFGPFISSISGLAFGPGAGTLGNMAARVAVGTGANVGIGGFIVRGTPGKPVVLRGIGPSITSMPQASLLADPVIELFDARGVSIARNDNFADSPEANQITNAGLAPTNSKESAILRTLNDGNYTVVLSGANGTSGIGLVEIYDVDAGSGSRLANLSSRGLVQSGDQILIGGIIVTGSASQRVVARAIGPDLATRGVANPLQDPTIDIRNADGTSIGTNDNFETGGQSAELAQNGLTPGDPRDSAIIVDFAPGNYTALVTGVNSSGIALVEFYNLSMNNQ